MKITNRTFEEIKHEMETKGESFVYWNEYKKVLKKVGIDALHWELIDIYDKNHPNTIKITF